MLKVNARSFFGQCIEWYFVNMCALVLRMSDQGYILLCNNRRNHYY